MALRAKKPELTESRLKALVYADKGVGKTHFCCSFPEAYYIDSEKLSDYKHFTKMLIANNSDLLYSTELTEIIEQVQGLLSTPHRYKTLIIDGITVPYSWLSHLEAERLAKKPGVEGTEYGANLAKAKRLTFHLGILLTRLDMNVIVTAQEKTKFADGKEVGAVYDASDKIGYMLGNIWRMQMQGESRKIFIEKCRGDHFKKNTFVDFQDGFEVVKRVFGEEIFVKKTTTEILASGEQVNELKNLINNLHVPDETVQKWLIRAKAHTIEEIDASSMAKLIEALTAKIKGAAA